MTSSIQKLQKILRWLEKYDLAKMENEDKKDLRDKVTQDFVRATSDLHKFLLGDRIHCTPWIWEAYDANAFGGEWISSYSLIDSGFRDSAIGKTHSERMAKSLLPSMRLGLDIFAACNYSNRTDLHIGPRIEISVMACGQPEVDLVEDYLSKARAHWPKLGKGISLQIRPAERDFCKTISNPGNLQEGWASVLKSERKVFEKGWPEGENLSGINMVYEFDHSANQEDMTATCQYMGTMFAEIAESLKTPAA